MLSVSLNITFPSFFDYYIYIVIIVIIIAIMVVNIINVVILVASIDIHTNYESSIFLKTKTF